jgi:hypothetical protein
MISFEPRLSRTLATLVAIAFAMSGPAARAQRGRDLIDDDGAIQQFALPRAAGAAAQFDVMVFGRGNAEEARRRLESRLKSRIEQIDRACALSPEQRNKLAVAGRGDIKRAFARLDELKKQLSADPQDGRKQRQVFADLIPYRQSMTEMDCFGDGSLFSKVLKNTLTPEQLAAQQKAIKDASVAHHRATISWVVRSIDTWLQLSPDQHRKFEDLLLAETRPPRKWGEYDYYGLMCQAAKLSEKKLKPIFNDDQWGKLQKQLAEALRIEKMLRTEGFLPDESSTAAAPPVVSGRWSVVNTCLKETRMS